MCSPVAGARTAREDGIEGARGWVNVAEVEARARLTRPASSSSFPPGPRKACRASRVRVHRRSHHAYRPIVRGFGGKANGRGDHYYWLKISLPLSAKDLAGPRKGQGRDAGVIRRGAPRLPRLTGKRRPGSYTRTKKTECRMSDEEKLHDLPVVPSASSCSNNPSLSHVHIMLVKQFEQSRPKSHRGRPAASDDGCRH